MSWRFVTSLVIGLSTSACSPAMQAHMSEIDALMQRYDGAVPGASLLVVKDGKAVVKKSYGLADVASHVKATPETNYRLASVTKQFTAAAVLLLVEDGKLRLDDPIRKYFPSLPARLDAVTVQHLLTHTSGIIDYEDVMPAGDTAQIHDAGVLQLLEAQDSLYFQPGTKYQYSNSGYSLLALLVQKVSGESFATFLHDRIFAPLGMKHTIAFEEGISTVSHRAYGHTLRNGAWVQKDQSTTSAVLGDGGIYSSIEDMAKWDDAWYDSRLLSDGSRHLATSPHVDTDNPDMKYGFGWRISGDLVSHSGETSGFRNVIIRKPSHHTTVVLLTNRDDPAPYETALAILKLFAP